jgi:hypothetical protein
LRPAVAGCRTDQAGERSRLDAAPQDFHWTLPIEYCVNG